MRSATLQSLPTAMQSERGFRSRAIVDTFKTGKGSPALPGPQEEEPHERQCCARTHRQPSDQTAGRRTVVRGAPAARANLIVLSMGLLNTMRVAAYLPSGRVIAKPGNSLRPSLRTRRPWLGANATIACWLCEQEGLRMNRAIAISICNAATAVAIAVHRS